MEEEWRDVVGYEGLYMVSNLGRIKILKRKYVVSDRLINGILTEDGYSKVFLSDGHDNRKMFFVHRLVAISFIPNTYNKPCIDHINTIRTDNRIENLRWCTHKENQNNPITIQKLKDYNSKNKRYNYGYRGVQIKHSKPVVQYSMDMKFIKKWDAIADVKRINGWCQYCVSHCVNGDRKSAYGYIWKYYKK